MSEPNTAAREIASYIMNRMEREHPYDFSDRGFDTIERMIAEGIQEMIDNGQIYGGMVVTGDHEIGDRKVLDWSELGGRPKWHKIRLMRHDASKEEYPDANPL